MLKIAICDDEKAMVQNIEVLIKAYTDHYGLEVAVDAYLNGHGLISNWDTYDILFLDMQMPGLNGIEVAATLRKKLGNGQCKIIFVTSSQDLVFKAFEVNAFRYILKPLEQEKLFEVLDAARADILESDDQTLTFEVTQKRMVKLPFKAILYMETEGRKTIIHTATESFLSNQGINELEARVKGLLFFRSHVSFIVNLEHVKSHTLTEVTLLNDQVIPMSRLRAGKFKAAFVMSLRR